MRATLIHDRPIELDLEELRRRLACTVDAPQALIGDLGVRESSATLTPASVLMPIVAHAEQLTVLFTRRTAQLRAHSGQISFPGGRAEAADAGPEATALRETHEEIGLEPQRIDLIGTLREYQTRTGFRVTPVIGVLTPPLELRPDVREVEEVFEVPLSFLLDPRNHLRHTRNWQGRDVTYYAMPYGDHYIWGATAGMLVNFYRRLIAADA